jgi:hypothetical protein
MSVSCKAFLPPSATPSDVAMPPLPPGAKHDPEIEKMMRAMNKRYEELKEVLR